MKICITGPESSGKSALAASFMHQFHTQVISEYAREYLTQLNREYVQSDLELIAQTQLNQLKASHSKITISDTGVEVVKIWNDEKFHQSKVIDSLLIEQLAVVDFYWLCKPDIPWEPDFLRENPDDRMRLFQLYKALLTELNVPFIIIEGSPTERISLALADIEHKKTLS